MKKKSKYGQQQKKFNRVFQAKLLAIIKMAEGSNSTGEWYGIWSDCMWAIQALSKPFNVAKLIHNIHNPVKSSNNNLKISLVKAHVGIEGNKNTDESAKQVVQNQTNEITYNLKKKQYLTLWMHLNFYLNTLIKILCESLTFKHSWNKWEKGGAVPDYRLASVCWFKIWHPSVVCNI